MSGMFSGLKHFSTIDVSHFSTRKVKYMSNMFAYSNYTSLDLRGFDFSVIISTNSMFYADHQLTTIFWPQNINTPYLENTGLMFAECYVILFIDLSNWDFSNVTTMTSMFHNCFHVTTVSLPSTSFGNQLTTIYDNLTGGLFENCHALQTLSNLSSLNTPFVTDFTSTFKNCLGLTYIDLSNFTIPIGSTTIDMLNLGTNNNRGHIIIDLPQYINTNLIVFADNKN